MAKSNGSNQLTKSVGQDLLALLESARSEMTLSEHRIATYVLQNPENATSSSITKLAQISGVSEASVVRFCRSLKFSGYPEFRLALAADLGRRAASNSGHELDGGITVDDTLEDIIRKVGRADAMAIESTVARLDTPTLAKVVDACQRAVTIGVVGVGASAFVALDLQLKLNRLGQRCIAWTDAHTALTSMATLDQGDLLIAISHSGATRDIVDVLQAFRTKGTSTAIITNNPRSSGASKADMMLLTTAGESAFRSGATASRIAQLTLVDCLCIALAQRDMARTRTVLDQSLAAVGSRYSSNEPL